MLGDRNYIVDTISLEGHSVYYEIHGKEYGLTFLFFHGGPGLGCSHRDLSFFNLDKHRIILVHQRGSGMSSPFGELNHNTSENLINDFNSILIKHDITSCILFGGSWGSTLAFLFAIRFPNKTQGLILRGLFLGTKEERSYFEEGGVSDVFPRAWKEFKSKTDAESDKDVFAFYEEKILNGSPEEQFNFTRSLMLYGRLCSNQGIYDKSWKTELDDPASVGQGRIFMHYSRNNFFLPEKYIESHLSQLNDIPIHIVQGRNDAITRPEKAISLKRDFETLELHLTDGGHSPHDPENFSALRSIVEAWPIN